MMTERVNIIIHNSERDCLWL